MLRPRHPWRKKIAPDLEWISEQSFFLPVTWGKDCPAQWLVKKWISANHLDEEDRLFLEATPFQYTGIVLDGIVTINEDRQCFDGQGMETLPLGEFLSLLPDLEAQIQESMSTNPF